MANGLLSKQIPDAFAGLLSRTPDRTIIKRGLLRPQLKRVIPDLIDDVSEYEQTERAIPALAYDPLKFLVNMGQMLQGERPVDPREITKGMLDVGMLSAPVGLLGGVPKGAVLGANVFHGTPHRFAPEPDFPLGRPRLDKIGTGEGNQAYGYGFYSADAPSVAQTYKTPEGSYQRLTGQIDPKTEFAFDLMEKGQSASKIMEMMLGKYGGNITFDEAVKAIDGARDIGAGQGTIYKLDIPDVDVAKYLDWDKPLSEQPKNVRDALKNIDIGKSASVTDADGTARRYFEDFSDMSGGGFVDALTQKLGSQQATSEALRKAGIPGLKYFDQGSRPLGDTIGQTLVVRGKEIDSDDLTGSFAANRLLESNMDFDAAKRIARGMGQNDVVKVLDDWATTPDKVSIKDKRTRNYVTWDQDVLNRSKMLERDGVTLGANKSPTAALPGLLGKTSSELRAEANALRFPNEDLNINAELAQSAKDYFGVTRSPNETGYIMQDGTRLDLSGRHYAGGYEKKGDRFVPEAGKPDYLGGDRAVDHRELYDLKGLKEGEHQWDRVEQLMRETGAVRYMPNQGISIIDGQKVSNKQLEAIVSDFRKSGNSLTVDIDPVGGGSRAVSKTFDRPTVEGVRKFIGLGSRKTPTDTPSGLLDDIKPAKENIRTVLDANTIGGSVVGDETVPIGLLSGGASSSARAQKAIDDIADSMSGPEGYVERLIVDQDNNVIEGAHRLEALRKLGVDEVPVTRIVDPQASFTYDTEVAMRASIQKAKKTHPDHENQIISQLGEMLADPEVAGDPKKVFEVYDPAKGFEDQFKAALKIISTK